MVRYLIQITTPEKETIEKIRNLILKSNVYNSQEIVNLHPTREICDDCYKEKIID